MHHSNKLYIIYCNATIQSQTMYKKIAKFSTSINSCLNSQNIILRFVDKLASNTQVYFITELKKLK